ncbi:Polynucleotide 5'-hydroxyl-kinase grc3 [Thelotrema lepadinum]|nr:Polynucleotide 5'-hydroxyl-kinase grc3 [Thelotrema lepadinum]
MIQRMEKSPLAFDTYSDWLAVANKIKKRNTARLPVILVCGAKGSGKSTLTRYLCNHFQSHQYRHCGIGLLDLDPGQPEYSPPAEISLIHLQSFNLGTPFSHPVVGGRSGQIVRRHYLGTFNPRDETSHYIESSQDLFQHYKRTIGRNGSPLIVNSCGWIQGSGLDTLLALVRHLQPTDIILLETEGISDVLHSLETVSWQTGASLQTCDSRVVNPRSARSPSDLREMQIYSYFHLAKQEEGPTRWASKPAHLQDELQLSYSEPEQTIVGILLLGEEINFDMLEDAIVGTVLALVAVEDTSLLIYGNDHGSGLVNQEDTQVERVADFTMGSLFDLTGHTDRTQNQIVLEDGSAQYIVNRNRQGIPYLSTKDGINRPLDPSKTCSLGQVLIQGVDRKSKRLTVVTPISTETIEKYKNMKNPLLLVRGRASMAGWSYLEEHCDTLAAPKNTERLERDTEAQQQLDNDRSGCESDHYFNLTKGTQKRHWVEFTTADGGTRRNKVWRVRRNLAT